MVRASLCFGALVLLVFVSVGYSRQSDVIDKYKAEVAAAERDFAKYAQDHSVREAFLKFAAPEAVLLRGKNLIQGRNGIEKYFAQQTFKEFKLNWKPDFVDVAKSGDLGYTYGKYTLEATDSEGNKISDQGVFHTVWKRQSNGDWKFVWD